MGVHKKISSVHKVPRAIIQGGLKMKLALLLIVLGVNSIAASTLPNSWRGYAYTLMCNHPGSNRAKATKVRVELSSDYPANNWVVAVSNQGDASAYYRHRTSSTRKFWRNTCGKDMYVWTKP